MAETSILCFSFFFLIILTASVTSSAPLGKWTLLRKSIGISGMHMQLLNNDRVIIFDRTDFGRSNLSLPTGKCRNDNNDFVLKYDCTAHSAEYNVATNSIRALTILTDTWCSSGAVSADGVLIQTGGFNDGDHVVRLFQPCPTCDWDEIKNGLGAHRWYATNQILPNGQVIVIGGQENTYEFYPKTKSTNALFPLNFLEQSSNLYPFVHLNVDGNLFIFAYNAAILLNYQTNTVVKTFPTVPDYQSRTYPFTGSSVLLPLETSSFPLEAEVLVCGGAPWVSYEEATSGIFIQALNTCGRIRITDPNPKWTMETMPLARVMGDMVLLPSGHVLIINGAANGLAGWELGRNPVLHPVLYEPNKAIGSRFQVLNPTTIPRLYHSTALLLRDGRVLVAGSNPHQYYNFTGVLYPTELSLEAFSPVYLDPRYSIYRPTIVAPASNFKLRYGQKFVLQFTVSNLGYKSGKIQVTMVAPSFTTHSFGMSQRLLILNTRIMKVAPHGLHAVEVTIPDSTFLAPSGYYLLFLVHRSTPSEGIWVQIL